MLFVEPPRKVTALLHCSATFLISIQQGALAKNFRRVRMAVLRLDTIMQVTARKLCASHEEWRILLKSL